MEKYQLISKINSPQDLKQFNIKELENLAIEIRSFLLDKISKNGGHIASNLGIVEATIALHYVFDSPKDKLIFDVGHQGYVHKILTGRAKDFDTLRKYNGLSGFLKESESEHDVFEAGHSSTAISAMTGFLEAKHTNTNTNTNTNSNTISNGNGNSIGEVVGIVGDASLQSGISLAGLNYLATKKDQKGIIILNDNEMSIGKNIGGFTNIFNNIRVKKSYKFFRKVTPKFLRNILKTFVYGKLPVFSQLGYRYIGPIDGHNIKELIKYFQYAKEQNKSIIVHIKTIKGKGYEFSENDKIGAYHGVSPFDLKTGLELNKQNDKISFSKAVGVALENILENNINNNNINNNINNNKSIKIITPGMTYGTGLTDLSIKYKENFIDVGICEENAIIMASALACSNFIPICLTYSTFYQRAYDEINHDVCRSNKHVIMLSDRAGIVPGDGDTHQGIFDLSMLTPLPNLTIGAPSNYEELLDLINVAINGNGPFYIRYPKTNIDKPSNLVLDKSLNRDNTNNIQNMTYKWKVLNNLSDINILTYGPVVHEFNKLIESDSDLNIGLINAWFIKPIDEKLINSLNNKTLIIYEEVIKNGSLASLVKEFISDNNLNIKVISYSLDSYVNTGSIDEIKNNNNLSIDKIIQNIKNTK